MVKIKKILLAVIILSCFIFTPNLSKVNANTTSNPNYEIVSGLKVLDKRQNKLYEFDSEQTMRMFLEEQPLNNSVFRNSPVYGTDIRNRVIRTYNRTAQSSHLIKTVYGGSHGATMSIGFGVSYSIDGIGLTTNASYSFPVPAGKHGNIVVHSNVKYTEYIYEQKVGKKWKKVGSYTAKNVTSSDYRAVYW